MWLWKEATLLWQLRIAILGLLAASRPRVTSGVTCVVTGSRKQGVQTSGELSGCCRAGRLEAVAVLCAHCWASYSSRVSESAAGSVALPAGGLGKMVAFPVPVGVSGKTLLRFWEVRKREGVGSMFSSRNQHPLRAVGSLSVLS